MSTFCGIIEDIPGISVDRFSSENFCSSAFFLSHCHTDHMEGLDARFFLYLYQQQQNLYCTSISKTILMNMYGLNNCLANTIRTVDGCAPIIINHRHDTEILYLTVTCVSAGHCPGSTMFIFETRKKSILYTGDFRIDEADFAKLKSLHNIVNGKTIPKKFDTVYLDTTFFDTRFNYFPSRSITLREICKVVHDWISRNQSNIVILECSGNYGSEHLFIQLSKVLGIRVHVKRKVFNSYALIPELADCITNDPYISQLHACTMKNNKNDLKCRPDVRSESIITVVPSAMRWESIKTSKNICEWDEGGKRFYACYSCHSSRDELETFIKYFRPRNIHPCVCSKRMSLEELRNQLYQVMMESETSSLEYNSLDFTRYIARSECKPIIMNLSDDDDDDDDNDDDEN